MTRKSGGSSEGEQRLRKAVDLKLKGEHTKALLILEMLLVEEPENVDFLEEIADNELSLEQYPRAEAAAKQVISLRPDSNRGHYILGFIHSHKEQWDDAAKHLQEANRLQPNNPEILRCLGWALFHQGLRLQGIVTLERALNLESDNTFALCDLGVAYLEIRNFSKARALFRRVLDLDPADERAKECVHTVDRMEKKFQDQ